MDNLRFLCFDLFLAGQETTATTLSFLVLYLLLDQRVQEKMQAELDILDTGRNGFSQGVTLADRGKLPYVNAVINVGKQSFKINLLYFYHKGGTTFMQFVAH